MEIEELDEHLETIAEEARRKGSIIHSIRNFVQRHEPQWSFFAIRGVITDEVRLLQPQLRPHAVKVEQLIPDQDIFVNTDHIQLTQVVVNLLMNSVEALLKNDVSNRSLIIQVEMDGQRDVVISVTDNGSGIAAEDQDKVFDQLFSTKDTGMGMGLAISRTIVEAHSGRLAFDSDENGTTFRIHLPTDVDQLRHKAG